MASYQEIQNRWSDLTMKKDLTASDLSSLKDEVYSALSVVSSREERKALAELLSTIQNKIWSLSKSAQKRDVLASILAGIESDPFLDKE